MDSPKRLDNTAGLVIDYLKSHPDFLRDHPSILREITVPHLVGAGVTSLIERQVQMLRTHCSRLQQELELRRTRAGIQRTTLQNVHAATLKVLRCRDFDSIYDTVIKHLQRDYGVDELRVFVFSDAVEVRVMEGMKLMPRSAKLRYMFIELINRNKPLCGSLQDEHIRMLFQAAAGHVNSTLIVPMRHPKWEGLIAMGSHERGRYGRGFELDMLQHLFAVVGARMDEVLSRPTA